MIATLSVSACDQVSDIEAFVACTERLEKVFPEAKGLSEKDFSGNLEGVGETGSEGDFEFSVPATNTSRRWTCKGSSKSRRIDAISYDGAVKKPANAEYWSY